jgi:predicted DNA-binding transcriptional regulator YafY
MDRQSRHVGPTIATKRNGVEGMHLATRPPLARILVIDQALRAGSWPNARTLGDRLEVNPRTIRRDIEYLRDQLHAPIEFDSIKNGYHYSEPSYHLPFLRLTEGELVALFLAEQMLGQYRGTPYGPDLSRAFAKITAALNDPIDVDAQRLSEAISFRTTAPAVFDVEILRTLIAAIVQRRRVVIDYWTASRDSQNRREVDPYHLTSCDGQYYLIAYCHMRRGFRQFVPGRIREIKLTETFFTRDESFRVDDYLSGSLAVFRGDASASHTVRLRFTGAAVRYVRERLWHHSQQIETAKDGALLVSFEVTHLREAERLVLTWAPECEALAPAELRDSVRKALGKAVRVHARRKAPTRLKQ